MSNVDYNEKVLEHFRNPRNMGEIKNPDAEGVVGNPTCLLPDEKILFDKKFDLIKNSDQYKVVSSHDLTKNKILNNSKRGYTGHIITLKNCLGQISLTPEHLIYAIKIPKENKFLRTKNKKNLIASWYHAQNLEKRDIILYPIDKEEKDTNFLKIDIPKSMWDFRSKKLNKEVPLNSDLLRLFGYFLSEGNIQEKPSKNYISFSLNINEKDIVEDIKNICKKLFNLDVKISEEPKRKTARVYLYNAQLARFFKNMFGNGAGCKKIPETIMKLSFKKQESLLYALWKGDGYVNIKRDGPRGGYATICYELAEQIKILLLRQNIIPSFYQENERTSKWANHKKTYRVHVGQRESLIKLCKILKMKYCPKSYSSQDSWIVGNFLYTPITKIEKNKYSGDVYNLEVENKHSFLSNAFSLHNCGDVMKIMIKVKDDKIADIKFQTFGCAAAIASSSALTEIAKGKTIKEAKKITNEQVAKHLGQLPPIKLHCSNLAADALHKAIENWEERK
jgi:NifU-like protein involved in Fe-S cluster formation